ncbi:MAG: glutamine-hydrolyzing carbamoyl-phosphate synthase small subunit [Lachnospiraceae bacterium]|nr:glutamine-hydrolyzing carbamoyl-phosphate synthase small subunit [Lachnospiraceae bacterium]
MTEARKIILEDGTVFFGRGFGDARSRVCELVFNTSVTGYQEIVSDPSYTDQGVVMSYPLIGNYGITDEDFESRVIAPSALIVRDLNEVPSNFRWTRTLDELLTEAGTAGVCGVDTRRLVKSIRDAGARRALITSEELSPEEGVRRILETEVPHDAVRRRSCRKKWYSRTSNPRFNVVVIDCGMKKNIVRELNRFKCNVTIVPFDTAGEEILALAPDGVLISNGPGDPVDVPEVVETLKNLRGKVPMFGICLGHQLLSLSFGARTVRLKFGHHGGNHPVKELATGRIEITSQNHNYAVEEESLRGTGLRVSHVNVLDNTVEGVCCEEDSVFSVQYHPESAPGPVDSTYLFQRFLDTMEGWKDA